MKKTIVLAIVAIFICSSVCAGKTIKNAPGGKRTAAQLTGTMAIPLDTSTSDYWTDLAEHYAWVKAQMDVLYASKPWYDGAANSGSLIKLYGPTVANGGHGTWTALQGADYVGTEGTGMTWRLPIAAYPSAGTTSLLNVDEYGQMGLLAATTYAAASHNQAYTTLTGVTGASKYLGTDAGGTYGIFDLPSGGSMTWPSAGGIPLYSGSSSWGTSLSSSTALHYLRRNATNDGYEFGALPSFLASADIDTSSELRAILSDESGTGALIFANGALGTPSFTAFNLPTSDASPGATIGQMKHDSVTTGLAGGAVAWYDGAAVVRYLVDLDTLPTNDDYVVAYDADADKFYMKSDATGAGYTNLTSFIEQTAWRLFYSDGSGDVKELALGADGEYLKSNGAAVAPSWATPSGATHDAVTLSTDLGNNLLGLSTQQLTLDTQTANTVLAGPATGEAVAPTFRALVAADIPSLTGTYAAIAGTPSTSFQIDNDASGPLLKWDSGNTRLMLRNAADDAYYDLIIKNLYVENINSTKADGAYFANFDNTIAITFTPAQGDLWSETGVLKFRDTTNTRNVLNDNSSLDDDKVSFDDADSLWTATTIGAALEELNDSINAGAPNGTGAKVHWSQLLGMPAAFADGTDDGGGFSPLTYDDLTWGAAAGGSQTWTWDTGSSTDPSLVISDTYFTFNKIIQCAGIETTRSATVGGSVRIGYEGSNNGDNYIDMKAPDSRSTSLVLLYPTADPSEGQAIAWSAPSTEVSTGTWYTPVKEGTATGGILFGDASPDTAGEFGYTSNQLSVHDGTALRDVLQVASTTITKTEYIPIAYAEDGSVAPSASAVTASTRKVRTREFSGTADNDVEIHWMVPADYAGGVKFRFVGYVTNATAPADTEVVAFSLAGCSNGNSDVLGCTAGTAQTSSLTADANYVQYDRLSGAYSSAITITDIAAGESAHLKLTRLATTTDTYGRAFGLAGIEIKYQAKVNASGDY